MLGYGLRSPFRLSIASHSRRVHPFPCSQKYMVSLVVRYLVCLSFVHRTFVPSVVCTSIRKFLKHFRHKCIASFFVRPSPFHRLHFNESAWFRLFSVRRLHFSQKCMVSVFVRHFVCPSQFRRVSRLHFSQKFI